MNYELNQINKPIWKSFIKKAGPIKVANNYIFTYIAYVLYRIVATNYRKTTAVSVGLSRKEDVRRRSPVMNRRGSKCENMITGRDRRRT
jgi:hypothetical protein